MTLYRTFVPSRFGCETPPLGFSAGSRWFYYTGGRRWPALLTNRWNHTFCGRGRSTRLRDFADGHPPHHTRLAPHTHPTTTFLVVFGR